MQSGYFKVANVYSPLVTSTANSLLLDADPCLYYIIKYFTGVLQLHLQDRWNAEVALLGREDLIDRVVNETIPYDPFPLATDTQLRFPLLAAYRLSEKYDWKTIAWYHITSKIQINYILPPLTADQKEGLTPFLTHAARTLNDRTEATLDTNFNNGEQVWVEAGLEEISITDSTYGKIPNLNSNMYFPAVSLTLTLLEKRMPITTSFDKFDGIDVRVKIVEEDCPCDLNFIDIRESV